jgi:hypothetical protein
MHLYNDGSVSDRYLLCVCVCVVCVWFIMSQHLYCLPHLVGGARHHETQLSSLSEIGLSLNIY